MSVTHAVRHSGGQAVSQLRFKKNSFFLLNLIEGNTLFVDGTKIRANASIKNSWTQQRCSRHLKKIDMRIKDILSKCEAVDRSEDGCASLVTMQEELKDQDALKSRVEDILNELKAEDKQSTNTTDPECTKTHARQGSYAGYNMQSTVDEKHGLIVNSDVVNENNDRHQFAEQIEQAHATLNKKCQTACADAGYACVDELEKIDKEGIKVIVPSQRQALHEGESSFSKSHFTYDKERDCYYCPEGHRLNYQGTERSTGKRQYQIGHKKQCHRCRHYGQCTTSKRGRKIKRLHNEEVKLKLEVQRRLAQ